MKTEQQSTLKIDNDPVNANYFMEQRDIASPICGNAVVVTGMGGKKGKERTVRLLIFIEMAESK